MYGARLGAIQLRAAVEQLGGQLRADEAGKELAQDHVLVVPAGSPSRLLEDVLLTGLVVAKPINQPVVQLDEGDRHLAGEQVHVVARISDEGDALVVARDVASRVGEQELGGVVLAVQVGRADGARAVDALQVGLGDAKVADLGGVGAMSQG